MSREVQAKHRGDSSGGPATHSPLTDESPKMPDSHAFVGNLYAPCLARPSIWGFRLHSDDRRCTSRRDRSSRDRRASGALRVCPQMLNDTFNDSSHFDRGTFLRLTALSTLAALPLSNRSFAETEFTTYKGPISLGFSFSYPSTWTVKKKPIKTHLSEVIVTSNEDSTTTAGIVVDAVKIDAIDRFGSPEVVGQKVVDVETKKENVNGAAVLSANSVSKDGLTYYVIDYTVDSTRGLKRYLAKATVTGGQLYVFTAQAKVDSFEGRTEDTLSKMLESFSVAKQYL